MPLRLPDGLPAIDILKRENINIADMLTKEEDKRAIRIVILNLMPFKSTTETDFIRLLSNSPLLLDISFLKLKSHTSKHTPEEHMNRFYHTLEEVSKEKIDGLIVTGAPVEDLPFEEVDYWKELQEIFNWAREHVRSTLYICWAAQAGLYHFYDIPKYPLPKKMFGIFPTIPLKPELSLFRGFDDVFRMPQSRHTEVRILNELTTLRLSLSLKRVACLLSGRVVNVNSLSQVTWSMPPTHLTQSIVVTLASVMTLNFRSIIIVKTTQRKVRWSLGVHMPICSSQTG